MRYTFSWRAFIVGISIGAFVVTCIWLPSLVQAGTDSYRIYACAQKASEVLQVDCWLQITFDKVRANNLAGAFLLFERMYDTYPYFGSSGCHQHAHKIGDTSYYELYLSEGRTLQTMDFPQETTSCGYGFFHGFIEHLIQDRPEPAFVTQSCEYLRDRLSATMGSIAIICYHASGHGFIMAKAGRLTEKEWGNALAIVPEPLRACESIPVASEREIEDCRQGVFNVISDWMALNDYGLHFDFTDPFAVCNALQRSWRHACYYELGMKLGGEHKDDPEKAVDMVQSITDPQLREVALGVMVAGMMQRQAPLDGYKAVFESCTRIENNELFRVCIYSAASGMMEHGSPGKEYEKLVPTCALPILDVREGSRICYRSFFARLSKFYPPEKKASICKLVAEKYQEECNATS